MANIGTFTKTEQGYIDDSDVLTLGVAGWPGLGLAGSATASLIVATATALVLARAVWSGRLDFIPSVADARLRRHFP